MSDMNQAPLGGAPSQDSAKSLIPVPATNLQVVRLRNGLRPSGEPEQQINARFVLNAWRRWWLLATPAALLLAAIGGTIAYLFFEPVYEAAAWFRIEDRTPYLAFESKTDDRSKTFFQTQIELIRSPMVVGAVLKRPEIARLPELEKETDPAAWLAKHIKVTPVGESELFRIVVAGPEPKNAASLVNAVTEVYFKLRDQSEGERNRKVVELLDQEQRRRLQEVQRLRETLRELTRQVTGKDVFPARPDAETTVKHPLADLQGRLVTAQVERAVLEARIQAAENELQSKEQEDAPAKAKGTLLSKQEGALRDVMVDRIMEENAEVQKRRAVISAKQATLSEIEEKSAKGKSEPLYLQKSEEITKDEKVLDGLLKDKEKRARVSQEVEWSLIAKRTEMEASLVAKRVEELGRMRSELDGRRIMEEMFKAQYDKEYEKEVKTVKQTSGDTLELEFKRDELARAEKVFEMIAQRALQLQTERGAPARVSLLKPAEPPIAPVALFPYRNVALASLAGLFLPFLLAVLWERMIRRVSDPEHLEQQSHLTVLGEVARLPARARVGRRSSTTTIGDDLRVFEESIDSLRTSLALSADLKDLRILAVTSAANHEGKTSVAAQLAVSMARASGEPVLLIDGDMRSPDLHNVFEIPLEPGLADVLGGECTLQDAIVTNMSKHVHLLPAGRLRASPHRLLGNGAWKSLVGQISAHYRHVIIDTPPVLAASEALVLTNAADASLLCVMRDVSRMDQVRKACERLAAAGSHLVGTVLNGVPVKQYAYRYGVYANNRG